MPLTSFIALKLWLNINIIHNAIKDCSKKCFQKYIAVPTDNNEEPIEVNEIGIVVDDNMRRNAIIVDV